MSRVFISYNREDHTFAERLRDQVRGLGYDTWLDQDDIPKGVYWPDAVDAGLRAADVVVGIMTPASLSSRNVKNEWDWALDNDKPLLLLRLRDCQPPHRYISLNYIEFARDDSGAWGQLRAALADPARPAYRDDGDDGAVDARKRVSTDARNRTRMVDKVRHFWIKGVLERSLHGAALIELGLAPRPEAVEHPWDMELRHPQHEAAAIPPGLRITEVFDDLGGELLILGAPGAGKTTLLLELARDLLARAEADSSAPMPVVFNLSSWSDDRKPLADWLVDELNTRYQVPRPMGSAWVEGDQVLPLLDGLDEVNRLHRDACADAINRFRGEHGFLPMAVCSRIADYESLRARLHLQGAILIQPLTPEQIDAYLTSLGSERAAARQAVQHDPALLEVAQTPLLLSILALAYQSLPNLNPAASHREASRSQWGGEVAAGMPSPHSEGEESGMRVSAAGEDIANTRQRLFAAYVETLLKRRGAGAAYTPDQTRHWLSWLARGMLAHGHTVFFIENLQPDWLPEGWRRRVYLALARLMVGLTLGAAIGLAGGMAAGFPIGIAGGAAAGAGRGLGAGLTFTAFGLIVGLVGGLFGGLGMGVAVGAIDRQAASGNKINVVETLRWSPGKAFTGLLIGLAGGLVSGLIGGAAGGLANTPTTQLAIVLTIGLGVGLAGALVGGLSGREVGMRTIPNQGIWRSARNALRVGLIGALAGGLVVGVTFGSVAGASAPPNVRLLTGVGIGSSIGAAFGIAFGLGGGMLFGGLACLQHLVLRIVLACGGSLPWNYARFLDYATGRIFLRKVGGGYIFVHRYLLEYFASLPLPGGH